MSPQQRASSNVVGWLVFATVLAFSAPAVRAEVLPAAVFGDRMVLQRDMPVPVWGRAEPGEKVRVSFLDQHVDAQADPQGNWSVRLRPLKAGGPHELVVAGTNRVVFKDVLVGEVWICSGQSNMAMSLNSTENGRAAAAASTDDSLRLFAIPFRSLDRPLADLRDADPLPADRREQFERWRSCDAKSVGEFSAVGYWFGRDLRQHLGVPVGLVHAAVGATSLQYWVPAVEDPARGVRFERSGSCWNSVIAPLAPFACRGVLWYQGEANSGSGWAYRQQLPVLVAAWRKTWGQGDFPFLIAQLHQYRNHPGLPDIRESQLVASRAIPRSGLVVTADHDDTGAAHPRDKRPIGARFALLARSVAYGEDVVHSGPVFEKATVAGGGIVLDFAHVGGGLVAKGDRVGELEIAGADRAFVPATAEIRGKQVVVSSPAVPQPVAVRYAWRPAPELSLFNRDGLPAPPFRTDDWPLPSQPAVKPAAGKK